MYGDIILQINERAKKIEIVERNKGRDRQRECEKRERVIVSVRERECNSECKRKKERA